ncbi:MAG: hypothetical protein WDN49_03425 [Acetobacteraceae bacterium]
MAACEWELTAVAYGFDRIVIHEQVGGEAPEDGDFVLVYRSGDRWARWGAARQGTHILLWRCANGAEVGIFPTMRQALDALLDSTRLPATPAMPQEMVQERVAVACPGRSA